MGNVSLVVERCRGRADVHSADRGRVIRWPPEHGPSVPVGRERGALPRMIPRPPHAPCA